MDDPGVRGSLSVTCSVGTFIRTGHITWLGIINAAAAGDETPTFIFKNTEAVMLSHN